MQLILYVWHPTPLFNESLDCFDIVNVAVFETLTIMKNKWIVVHRENFLVDIGFGRDEI